MPEGPGVADAACRAGQAQHLAGQFQSDPPGGACLVFNGESWEQFGEPLPGLSSTGGRAFPVARGFFRRTSCSTFWRVLRAIALLAAAGRQKKRSEREEREIFLHERTFLQSSAAVAAFATSAGSARADNTPGITDVEIQIGQTMPYSGPASAYGVIGRTETAYFKMINEPGGVNGRKINLISLDDFTAHQKRSSRSAAWSNRSRSPSSSRAWARRATPRSGNISTTTRCRSYSS